MFHILLEEVEHGLTELELSVYQEHIHQPKVEWVDHHLRLQDLLLELLVDLDGESTIYLEKVVAVEALGHIVVHQEQKSVQYMEKPVDILEV